MNTPSAPNIIEIDVERALYNQSQSQLQNRNTSQSPPRTSYQERETLHQELQRERIRNLQIDSLTNIFMCIGVISACGFICYFVATGDYLVLT
jgi:hypothetical protein